MDMERNTKTSQREILMDVKRNTKPAAKITCLKYKIFALKDYRMRRKSCEKTWQQQQGH